MTKSNQMRICLDVVDAVVFRGSLHLHSQTLGHEQRDLVVEPVCESTFYSIYFDARFGGDVVVHVIEKKQKKMFLFGFSLWLNSWRRTTIILGPRARSWSWRPKVGSGWTVFHPVLLVFSLLFSSLLLLLNVLLASSLASLILSPHHAYVP